MGYSEVVSLLLDAGVEIDPEYIRNASPCFDEQTQAEDKEQRRTKLQRTTRGIGVATVSPDRSERTATATSA